MWSHKDLITDEEIPEDEPNHLQMMAEDYLRMGMVNAEKIKLPEPYQLEEGLNRKIMVIGGGITGISAALDAAATGYDVTIVEKEAQLGGWAAKVRKQLPMAYPYEELQAPVIADLIAKVQDNPKITIKTGTVVARIAGQPGEFTVTFKKPGEKIPFDVPYPLPDEMKVDETGKELDNDALAVKFKEYNEGKFDILKLDPDGEKFGAVILAAGWKPYQPKADEYAHLGYGVEKDVITNAQFEEMAAKGKIVTADGQPAKSVAFIQSPGQGDDSDFPYASSVTSLVALKQAKYVTEDYEDGKSLCVLSAYAHPGPV